MGNHLSQDGPKNIKFNAPETMKQMLLPVAEEATREHRNQFHKAIQQAVPINMAPMVNQIYDQAIKPELPIYRPAGGEGLMKQRCRPKKGRYIW